MIKIAIIGGKLQGVEAVYLAKKAGFFSILIDKNENPPAKGICDLFVCADIREKNDVLISLLKSADFVLPAVENKEALDALRRLASTCNIHIAFDFAAYEITSSKKKSDLLFHNNSIPAPVYYPKGLAPYIAKPVYGSGSGGVRYLNTAGDAENFLHSHNAEDWIIQEYLSGKAYSIEVIGMPGSYKTYQITEIHVDENYDCKMVTCPCGDLTDEQKSMFSDRAVKIAELLELIGIMDVEGIMHSGVMKILEIDARFPSQTPAAVMGSTGVNLLAELHSLFCGGWEHKSGASAYELHTVLEHAQVRGAAIKEHGESLMAQCTPLKLYENFLGSDEVITDYHAGDSLMRATFINSAQTIAQLQEKRMLTRESLEAAFNTQNDAKWKY